MRVNGRDVSKVEQQLVQLAINNSLHSISILWQDEDGNKVYQWASNNGIFFSPPLPTMESAFRYPVENGLKPWAEPAE